jgi:hypothetical protein
MVHGHGVKADFLLMKDPDPGHGRLYGGCTKLPADPMHPQYSAAAIYAPSAASQCVLPLPPPLSLLTVTGTFQLMGTVFYMGVEASDGYTHIVGVVSHHYTAYQ